MSRRMEPKDENELALDDKLDVARTLLTLGSRIQLRHTKNEIEAEIKQAHNKEIESGSVNRPVVPGQAEILTALGIGPAQIGSGGEEGSSPAS